MAFSLSEAIDYWSDLIKNNFETEASKAIRDTADNIIKSTKTLRELFNDITYDAIYIYIRVYIFFVFVY